ncbi:MAG: hypothetical protein ACN4GZ_12060 [Acidimicrobiales bacterium]
MTSFLTRRSFLTGLTATVVTACTVAETTDAGPAPVMEPGGPPEVPVVRTPGSPIAASADVEVKLDWPAADGATSYDVELNGSLIATGLAAPGLALKFGDRSFAPQQGLNRWRVRAANGVGARWSLPDSFQVNSTNQVRARTFDFEDPGPLDGTVPTDGTNLLVGAPYAFGGTGQGVALRCDRTSNTRAYKNHDQLPIEECWLRLCVQPRQWSGDGVSINLGRIRTRAGDTALNAAAAEGEAVGDGLESDDDLPVDDSSESASELLYWTTGSGLRSTSVRAASDLPAGRWSQVQLGVKSDGTVELWQFDGAREILVGTGVNAAMAEDKSQVSFGNINPNLGITFEVWLDELAVGQHKLPWASPLTDRSSIRRPAPVTEADLGSVFSFVFGSCNNSSLLPYDSMAIGAAARMKPDFTIHLGDHGYPDTGAYRQSRAAYSALWSDLGHESNLSSLLGKPWLMVASDHDLGGNNISADTVVPFASAAFDAYNQNDTTSQRQGRYGSLSLAGGEVELIWLEEIMHRSPVRAYNGFGKTCLGEEQKQWFLGRVADSSADLLIVASQTTIGHVSESGWVQYGVERSELVEACRARQGWTRWLSGDKHTARWALFEERLVEWGAAAWAEIPQGTPQPAPGVIQSASGPAGAFPTRKAALASLGLDGVADATSFGHCEIDTAAGTAHFSVRDNYGEVRVQLDGTILEETINYRARPWNI